MDWNDLASNNLPVPSLQLQFSNRSSKATASELSALWAGDGVVNTTLEDANLLKDTQSTETNDIPRRSIESLEEMIQRHERGLLSSLLQHCNDETRQKTNKAVDHQLQEMWNEERTLFSKDSFGGLNYHGRIGDRSAELPASSPFHSLMMANMFEPDSTYVLEYWKIVERMSVQNINDSIEEFSRLAWDLSRPNKPPSMIAYTSAWHLMADLIQSSNAPVDQAKAMLSHFCKQYLVTVANRVRQASLVGQDTESMYLNDVAAQCAAFTRLTIGNIDPWAVCFYCLRCGDANAALYAMERLHTDASIHRLLSAMARTQGTASCIWDSPDSPLCLDASDRRTVTTLLERYNDDNASKNVYKEAVLTLLSANTAWPFNLEASEGFKTIEDFLTGSLWLAVVRSNPVDHLIKLGEVILNLGPSYFDDPSSGGWAYALPLLATQQYQKALLWLTEVGGPVGLLQSTHIGLVLSLVGIPIRNLGQTNSIGDGVLTNLLVAYSGDVLKGHGSLASLDYLVRIPSKVRAYKEVANLIATTEDIATIVGTLNTEGVRQGGAITKYYTDNELSSILTEASDLLYASDRDTQKLGGAVMCLMLAERYDDALSMLNRLLAPPNSIDNSRHFWLEQVSLFHSHYISKRTHVLEVLERNGKTSVIRASLLLMDLNLFFDRLRIGNSTSECLAIAQKTNLLPSTEADRKIRESDYFDLDPLVQESIPFLLIGVMEILSNDYSYLKMEIHRDTSRVVRERLKELKENARLLMSYASSLGISNYQIGILTQLMSLMI
jgi:Nup93/Nic96